MVRRIIGLGVLSIIVLAIVIQLVPYGRNHANPPVRAEPKWDAPGTRQLAAAACFDCHSNETTWPPYSNVAPVSWLVQRDVDKGRQKLNFSEWDRPQREAREAAKEVQRAGMPPLYYVPLHPAAALSTTQRDALVQGLQKTVAAGAPPEPARGESERRERD